MESSIVRPLKFSFVRLFFKKLIDIILRLFAPFYLNWFLLSLIFHSLEVIPIIHQTLESGIYRPWINQKSLYPDCE